MENKDKRFPIISALEGVVIAILGFYSLSILIPQINYWKDRCSSLQQELTTKTSGFQASLDFFDKKIEVLEKENAALKESNVQLTKKLEDIRGMVSSEKKGQLQDELADAKQSLEALSSKLQNQSEKISEVKINIKTTKTYLDSSSRERNFPGEVVYKDGRRQEFDWMGSELRFSMGQFTGWSNYLYFSMNAENTEHSNKIYLKDIAKIDFLDITEAQKEKGPDSKWPMKAKITFIDDKVWDNVYLFTNLWEYQSKYSDGRIISRGMMWGYANGFRDIKSIIFRRK